MREIIMKIVNGWIKPRKMYTSVFMNRRAERARANRYAPFVFYFLLLFTIFPITHKACAAVPVPMNIQVEYSQALFCRYHPSCCPIITEFPWGRVTGGVSSDPEAACMSLMKAQNDVWQCKWTADGNAGIPTYLYDGVLVSGIESGFNCLLTKSNPDGTYAGTSTLRDLEMSCPKGYSEINYVCVLTSMNPHKNNNTCPRNGSNPIHTALGYKLQRETDYSGGGANTLEFKRYYTSGDHWEQSGLGYNWRHTYAKHINLNSTEAISTATVYRPNGDRFYFTVQNDDTWLGDRDVTARLTRMQDADGQLTGWEYTDSNNNVERYDASGKLITITDLMGRVLSIGYDANDHLASVSDTLGNNMSFTYDGNGRINKITDPSGGEYEYTYSPENNLIQVTRPNQTIRQYHYNEQQYTNNTNLQHALTGITDENGDRYAIYRYDLSGRAISSEHAGGVDKHSFSFNADGTTTVTNSLGKQTTYRFVTIEGVKKVTQVEGHPTTSCEGANKAYSYDANGNVSSKTDWNGVTTTYTYDLNRNLELTRTEASGTPQARTITTEWHPQFRLPTKITEPGKITEYTYDGQGRQLSINVLSAL